MQSQGECYGKKCIRKKNMEKRKLFTIFFPNSWNFQFFFSYLKNCKTFILACISDIDHSWLIKLLVALANNGKQIHLIMNCRGNTKNDEIFQAVICELLIESQFKIKIAVNTDKDQILPTNFCIIDGEVLISTQADWTIDGFSKKHQWMSFDKYYDDILEMIEEFEQIWNSIKFVTFEGDDLVFLGRDNPGFQQMFYVNQVQPILIKQQMKNV